MRFDDGVLHCLKIVLGWDDVDIQIALWKILLIQKKTHKLLFYLHGRIPIFVAGWRMKSFKYVTHFLN